MPVWRRLWQTPTSPHPFWPLSLMTEHWSNEAREKADHWIDADLVEEGMRLFEELPRTAVDHVLLATDLHAGNVLRSRREPWLVIDPTRLRTRLYVGYRPDGLYIGAICWDDDPTEIVIGQSADSDRTGEGYQEDRIEVYMDRFRPRAHDRVCG
ncbi:MAG: aminoglycoside phosphotransferase family protein [Candidatus Latescibacterota bacterium]